MVGMAADDSTELLPVMGGGEPSFDSAMRGYDRRQVDDYVGRLEADLLDLRSSLDLALGISADRAAQLAGHAAHIEALQQQLRAAKQALSAPTPQDQATAVLDEARTLAAEIVRTARSEADAELATARDESARLIAEARADTERDRLAAAAEIETATATAAQRTAEAEQRLAQARMQAVSELDSARAEAGSLLMLATDERDRLDAASLQARAQAEEDFEITLRARRTAAAQQAEAALAATRAETEAMVAAAQAQLAAIATQRAELHTSLVGLHDRLAAVIADTVP